MGSLTALDSSAADLASDQNQLPQDTAAPAAIDNMILARSTVSESAVKAQPTSAGDFAQATAVNAAQSSVKNLSLADSITQSGNGFSRGRQSFRPQSPILHWRGSMLELDSKCGRVLVVDFLTRDPLEASLDGTPRRRVEATEYSCLHDLQRLYEHGRRDPDCLLRLFHVQNAPWATRYLLKKFGIDQRSDIVGTDFANYVRQKRAERRGGRPFPTAQTWPLKQDPWRGICKTAFGFDYLGAHLITEVQEPRDSADNDKIMGLHCFDEHDKPTGYDAFLQRLSCYIQLKMPLSGSPSEAVNGVQSPYQEVANGDADVDGHDSHVPDLRNLDSENAIIIFDNPPTGSFRDCLIPARSKWEKHWRRLPFSLVYETNIPSKVTNRRLALACTRIILDDIFRSLASSWERFLALSQVHVSILEDKVYERPADETRASDLWSTSAHWLKVQKVATVQSEIVLQLQENLRGIPPDSPEIDSGLASTPAPIDIDWLGTVPASLTHIRSSVEEDLIKPTQALIQLLYQSVSIRDSRHSLALGHSMWRLSWITFIFLPLTFIVGFFGMNVDIFSNDPSIKWYFVAVIPFMACVLGLWWLMRRSMEAGVAMRGVWDTFFTDLSTANPHLWTRGGPRKDVSVTGLARWKWWFVTRWSRPDQTINAAIYGENAEDELGMWWKFKRYLIRRWTSEIAVSTHGNRADEEALLSESEEDTTGGFITHALHGATELVSVPGKALASAAMHDQPAEGSPLSPTKIIANVARVLSSSHKRSGSEKRNSGVLVEEEDPEWIQQLVQRGDRWWFRPGNGHSVEGGSRNDDRATGGKEEQVGGNGDTISSS